MDRSGRAAGQAALDAGLRVLESGEVLGIYPEGTRSHDGRLYKGKVGVAAMALRSGAPVIPCAMIGTFEAQPAGRLLPRLVPVRIRFGEPLDFSRYAGMEDHRAVLRAVTDEIMYAILKLSEQEYVDRYAAEAKAELQTCAPRAGCLPLSRWTRASRPARAGRPTRTARRRSGPPRFAGGLAARRTAGGKDRAKSGAAGARAVTCGSNHACDERLTAASRKRPLRRLRGAARPPIPRSSTG
ncbi:hypothetical protein GCM10020000_74180 [Streptomyces olivoverticillatus]